MATESNLPPSPSSTLSVESIIPLNIPISTKLSDSNFPTWQSQILPLLHGYNLARFVESLPPEPTRRSTSGTLEINPEYFSWRRQDQLLLGWIRSSLTESIQAEVVSCSTSRDLWLTLQRNFASVARSRVSYSRTFLALRQKESRTQTNREQHTIDLPSSPNSSGALLPPLPWRLVSLLRLLPPSSPSSSTLRLSFSAPSLVLSWPILLYSSQATPSNALVSRTSCSSQLMAIPLDPPSNPVQILLLSLFNGDTAFSLPPYPRSPSPPVPATRSVELSTSFRLSRRISFRFRLSGRL